jgi:hypothetical protein
MMPPSKPSNEGEVGLEEAGVEVSPNLDNYQFEKTTAVGLGSYKVQVSNAQFTLWAQLLAAMVLLIAITSTFGKSTNHYGYAISVAVIAMFFCLLGLLLSLRPDARDQLLFVAPLVGTVTIGYGNAIFLFAWWTIAAGILTFNGPFTDVSFIPRRLHTILLHYYYYHRHTAR